MTAFSTGNKRRQAQDSPDEALDPENGEDLPLSPEEDMPVIPDEERVLDVPS